jgi:hypothetical protein
MLIYYKYLAVSESESATGLKNKLIIRYMT